ncbi:hypothetical protein [Gracilibacillus salinarum]|uniref:Uncharacterized protein n=1 Tax=Gracilibacillus salinarum TaxID=2932255 RepID=A0ABY4GHG3_9BACI|nr:hypothetical protein [Gracilibacillus salinarum]UOQ83628.1 hypothetical protein MUN87_12770 [Gracilibacillus salinarum]
MKKRKNNRRISIVLIAVILFWNVLPVVGVAANFITPGQAITPGESITPGDPISGGEFIAPGEVYDYGEAYNDGTPAEAGGGLSSGEPIIEGDPSSNGQFIAPNAPPSFSIIVAGDAIQPGDSIQSGNQNGAGNAGSNGNAVEGGSGSDSGEAGSNGSGINGGDGNSTGSAIESGQSGSNGSNTEGGQAINGGDGTSSGSGDANGNAVDGNNSNSNGNGNGSGDALNGGNAANGNAVDGNSSSGGDAVSGNGTQGGNGTNGNATEDGEPPSVLNLLFGSTKDSDSIIDTVSNVAGDVKKYVLSFGDSVAQGLIATGAGFKFKELADGKYAVYGKNSLNSSIGNWFYERYKSYNFNGSNAEFGPNARRVGEARYNAFMQSKNLRGTGGLLGTVGSATKSSLNSSWNAFSKSFYKPSNMLKLGGPVGVALTSVSSVSKFSDGFTDFSGLASTDFAASLTTDVGIGVASTAIGSVASSAAAGALAGSVVPGLGTVIGAGVGLFAGFATTYLINGTATGRKIKSAVTNTIKKGYDGIVKGANAIKDGISSGISKLGSLFGG